MSKNKGNSVKFAHSSDWQLGFTRNYLGKEAQGRHDDERFNAVKQMIRKTVEFGGEFMVVAGDVFETNQPEHSTLVRACDSMMSSELTIFLVNGNHDSNEPGNVYASNAFKNLVPDNVKVLSSNKIVTVSEGVKIVPAPMSARHETRDLIAHAGTDLEPDPHTLRIMVGHGQTDDMMAQLDNPARISVSDAEELVNSGIVDYIALGDRHSAESIGSTGKIRYSGTPVATRRTESNPNKFLLVDLSEEACQVEEIQVGNWQFISESKSLENPLDIDHFDNWLRDIPNKEKTVLRISLDGVLDVSQFERVETICDNLKPLFAALRLPDGLDKIMLSPSESDYEGLQLKSFAKNALKELRELTQADGVESETARDALVMLYKLAKRDDQ